MNTSPETAVKRVGVSCETVAGQYGRDHRSRYQAIADENTADCEELVRALVNCRECELATVLYLFGLNL
jgi:hypothetical protein